MNNSPISDRLCSLIADGVEKFAQAKDIALCKKCPRSKTRKRVVVAQNLTPKNFFVLAEFPESEDEASSSVFSRQSSAGVILNLLEKLGIESDSHQSFALKCFAQNLTPDEHLPMCVIENLLHELRIVKPKILLCFGARAFHALSQFVMPINNVKLENSRMFEFETGSIEVYALPTAQELNQYPHWRTSVWSKLVHFKQKKNIAS